MDPMASDDDAFLSEGRLSCSEAERILPRLEREKIRFQIETDPTTRGSGRFFNDARSSLFLHTDDVLARERIRDEYFPV
jgi:hypothetical protein